MRSSIRCPAPDADPAPCNPLFADARVAAGGASSSGAGHGTHVAGIIGAKAADAAGVTGVAPNVSFLAYRVFGCNGGVDNDIIVAALERAYRDGAQVVNMSIGDDYASWPEEPTAQASDELVSNGVVVAVAMGNAGGVSTALFSGGDPGTSNEAITVGSVDNAKAFFYAFTVNGTAIPYVQATASPDAPKTGTFPLAKTGTPATSTTAGRAVAGAGQLDGQDRADPPRDVRLLRQGDEAQNAGAVGVILYNNAAGFVNPTVAGTHADHDPGRRDPRDRRCAHQRRDRRRPDHDDVDGDGVVRGAVDRRSHLELQLVGPDGRARPQAGPQRAGRSHPLDVAGPAVRRSQRDQRYLDGDSARCGRCGGASLGGQVAVEHPDAALEQRGADRLERQSGAGLLESPLREGAGLIKVDRSLGATASVSPRKIALGEGLGGAADPDRDEHRLDGSDVQPRRRPRRSARIRTARPGRTRSGSTWARRR